MERSSDKVKKASSNNGKSLVWDCNSTLYDSFELNSFNRQLNSAIEVSRTLSMPRLPDHQDPPQSVSVRKKSSKISRSINKLLRSVFKIKSNENSSYSPSFRAQDQPKDGFYVVCDGEGGLFTIPEVPEVDFGGFSPEINSLVRKTASARFPVNYIGISYA